MSSSAGSGLLVHQELTSLLESGALEARPTPSPTITLSMEEPVYDRVMHDVGLASVPRLLAEGFQALAAQPMAPLLRITLSPDLQRLPGLSEVPAVGRMISLTQERRPFILNTDRDESKQVPAAGLRLIWMPTAAGLPPEVWADFLFLVQVVDEGYLADSSLLLVRVKPDGSATFSGLYARYQPQRILDMHCGGPALHPADLVEERPVILTEAYPTLDVPAWLVDSLPAVRDYFDGLLETITV
jgi:hypothetical protein